MGFGLKHCYKLLFCLIAVGGCRHETIEPVAPKPKIYQLELVAGEAEGPAIHTRHPNYVDMIVRVTNGRVTTTDSEGNRVPDFSNPNHYVVGLRAVGEAGGNFSVLENGDRVAVEAGLRVASLDDSLQLKINLLLDVSGSVGEGGLLQAKNASKRLVARPCTPAETASPDMPCFSYTYMAWDAQNEVAVSRTEPWRSVLKENQTVNLVVFSSDVRWLPLREVDPEGQRYPDKTRQILDTIDRDIELGVDSTNLYGALLAGLDDIRQTRSLDRPETGLEDGLVVVFTDGSHTSGDLIHDGETLSPAQAISRIHSLRGDPSDLQSMRVILIALLSPELRQTIEEGELAGGGAKDLQNAGYLLVDHYSGLDARFDEAFDLIDRYARSMYRLYYRSPKTGSQVVDVDVRVTCPRCELEADGSIPEYATIRQSVQTNGFYQVRPGVYIDDPILDEEGQLDVEGFGELAQQGPETITIRPREDDVLSTSRPYAVVLANNPQQTVVEPANTELLRLHTYVRATEERSRPTYTVSSSDGEVLAARGVAYMTVVESVVLVECLATGAATLTVTDTANGGLSRSLEVACDLEPVRRRRR